MNVGVSDRVEEEEKSGLLTSDNNEVNSQVTEEVLSQ